MTTLHRSRRWRVLAWLCLIVGIGGYAGLVGLGLPLSGGDAGPAAGWQAGIAPAWLTLWLLAGALASALARRAGQREVGGRGQTPGGRGAGRRRCPHCGAKLWLRRSRAGSAPSWVCDDHGPIR